MRNNSYCSIKLEEFLNDSSLYVVFLNLWMNFSLNGEVLWDIFAKIDAFHLIQKIRLLIDDYLTGNLSQYEIIT